LTPDVRCPILLSVSGQSSPQTSPRGDAEMPDQNETIIFEAGKVYHVRSIGDRNAIWNYRVVRRTEKTLYLEEVDAATNKVLGSLVCRIKMYEGVETVKPAGVYSMAPTLKADNVGAMTPNYSR
jgi:hypothetical protein